MDVKVWNYFNTENILNHLIKRTYLKISLICQETVSIHVCSLVQGFSKIENLEEYTGLKCIWLENNCIEVIQNLDHLAHLKCLFLQDNR